MIVEHLGDDVTLYCADCLEVLPILERNSVDTVITDPPYGLEFMGKDWDKGVPGVHFWQEALRVAKPGALLLSFGGTRTYHRMVTAIEDAGWEIRDTIMWVYGSGFPKSYDISKGIDKQAGAERERIPNPLASKQTASVDTNDYGDYQAVSTIAPTPITPSAQLWDGWGTALKPAVEPICVAMKPTDGTYVNNALTWGVAGFWIDGGRVEGNIKQQAGGWHHKHIINDDGWEGGEQANKLATGRFPANLIHDGSEEVLAGFPIAGGGGPGSRQREEGEDYRQVGAKNGRYGKGLGATGVTSWYDEPKSSAARFFYCAKASRAERNDGLDGMETKQAHKFDGGPKINQWTGKLESECPPMQNHHPTVKPLALMEYLAKLTKTPTGGVVLDPFMGSGTTGVACVQTGRKFIGIEIDPGYYEIAKKRIQQAQMQIRMEI